MLIKIPTPRIKNPQKIAVFCMNGLRVERYRATKAIMTNASPNPSNTKFILKSVSSVLRLNIHTHFNVFASVSLLEF